MLLFLCLLHVSRRRLAFLLLYFLDLPKKKVRPLDVTKNVTRPSTLDLPCDEGGIMELTLTESHDYDVKKWFHNPSLFIFTWDSLEAVGDKGRWVVRGGCKRGDWDVWIVLKSRAAVDSQNRMDVIAKQWALQSPTRPRFSVPGPIIVLQNKFLEENLVCRFEWPRRKSRKVKSAMHIEHVASHGLHFPFAFYCFRELPQNLSSTSPK